MSQIAVEYMHLLTEDGARSSGGRRMRKSLNEGIDKFDLGTQLLLHFAVPVGRLNFLFS